MMLKCLELVIWRNLNSTYVIIYGYLGLSSCSHKSIYIHTYIYNRLIYKIIHVKLSKKNYILDSIERIDDNYCLTQPKLQMQI